MHHARNRSIAALVAAMLALAALVAGCSGGTEAAKPGAEESKAAAEAFPVTVKDDAGRDVTIASKPERIVSLAPANTEIVYALGLIDDLVGVTTYDDYPAEVKKIAKMGDFTTPNLEAIGAARPDVVLVTTGVQADVITKLENLGAKVVAVDPQTLEAVYGSIALVGKVCGANERAAQSVEAMRADVATIRQKVGGEPKVTAFLEIAQNPLYTAGTGTLLSDLLEQAGGTNVVTQPGYVGYSLEQLLKDDPQVYLATKGSMSDPSGLAKRAGYEKLSAVKTGRVAVLEDNLVSRPGPRVVQGVEQIARALHPKAFE